jgi:Flp pilus assembly protein TadD
VHQVKWQDDFSTARNVAVDFAKGDWILVIDADEVIAPADLGKVAALTPEPDVWGFSMVSRNYSSDRSVICWQPVEGPDGFARGEPGWFPSTKVRLFRNRPEIRFEGRIHECVEPSILRAGGRIQFFDVPVHHYGYVCHNARKQAYYLELAELNARENPNDARARFQLGIQYMVVGDYIRAEEALGHAVSLNPRDTGSLLNLGCVKMRLGKPEAARQLFERAAELEPIFPHIQYDLGVALEKTGRLKEAETRYAKALELDPKDANSLAKLGYLRAKVGDLTTAHDYLERSLRLDPHNQHARNNFQYVCANLRESRELPCDLSLNMIIRDESANLREGLAPIAHLFDEVVLVDTGSRDDTMQVAEQLGARVIRHQWSDDFADARNAALSASRGKWIFWLDADDRITPRAVEILRKFILRGIPCGVFFPLESRIGDNGTVVKNYTLRLFPNKPGIRWTGRVHEQIAGPLREAGIELVNCPDFAIRHVGYENSAEAMKKNLRNLNLLAQELAARPEDPYVMFSLAQTFLFCGQTDHAAKWLRTLWEMREKTDGHAWREVFWMAAVVLSDCALRSGKTDESEQWLKHAITLCPRSWLAYFLLGERKLLAGECEGAEALLQKVVELGISPTILPLNLGEIKKKIERYRSELKRLAPSTQAGA